MTRRELLASSAAITLVAAPARAPVVNAAEHAWVMSDARFPVREDFATCPKSLVRYDYSGEYLISEMERYRNDHPAISQVCSYGRDNS
jgi:hypothetical protein